MKRISSALAGVLLTSALTATGAAAATGVSGEDTTAAEAAAATTDAVNSGDRSASEGEESASGESADRPSEAELEKGGAYMGMSLEEEAEESQKDADGQQPQSRSFSTLASTGSFGRPGVEGIDVSKYQGTVNWSRQWNRGIRFAYIKATEGEYYESPTFNKQYTGSYRQGMIRGAYHFGNPDTSGGARQARYFVNNGGGWSSDGKTLPGVLDIEYDPYGSDNKCYGQSARRLVNWIEDFVTTYERLTGRAAVIYTNRDWWVSCTGNSKAFADSNPLWFARWNDRPGSMPGGWSDYTFWQYAVIDNSGGEKRLDHDVFHGSFSELREYADSCRSPLKNGSIFCDVSGNYVFADEIEWLSNQGITTGYPDGDFNPRRRITREAMAAFMYRYAGKPSFNAPNRSPFKDLSPGDPFYKEITWLADQGITTGYDDGTYRPRNKISREAMAAFLYRYTGSEGYQARGQEFSDVPNGYIFADEIAWLADQGITTGYNDGTFRPRSRISREATAAFLYRLARS